VLDWQYIKGFEWDAGNRFKGETKHSVTPQESEEIFSNQPLLLSVDVGHSAAEPRFHALGKTDHERLLHITYTIRADRLRIISARPMNRKEKDIYEKA